MPNTNMSILDHLMPEGMRIGTCFYCGEPAPGTVACAGCIKKSEEKAAAEKDARDRSDRIAVIDALAPSIPPIYRLGLSLSEYLKGLRRTSRAIEVMTKGKDGSFMFQSTTIDQVCAWFLKRKRSLIAGNPGTGKSTLAVAIVGHIAAEARARAAAGEPRNEAEGLLRAPLFVTANDLLGAVRRDTELIESARTASLLIIDGISTKDRYGILDEVLTHRYQNELPWIATTSLSAEDMRKACSVEVISKIETGAVCLRVAVIS